MKFRPSSIRLFNCETLERIAESSAPDWQIKYLRTDLLQEREREREPGRDLSPFNGLDLIKEFLHANHDSAK